MMYKFIVNLERKKKNLDHLCMKHLQGSPRKHLRNRIRNTRLYRLILERIQQFLAFVSRWRRCLLRNGTALSPQSVRSIHSWLCKRLVVEVYLFRKHLHNLLHGGSLVRSRLRAEQRNLDKARHLVLLEIGQFRVNNIQKPSFFS